MSFSAADLGLLKSIPLSLLESTPGGQPPPGIQPDFLDPPTRVPIILGLGIAFLVLAVVCFFIRIYTKLALAKNWKWDDLTCSLGFMCSLVYFVAIVMGSIGGAAGRHIWDLHLDKILNKSSLYQSYITTIMVTPALGLIKSSLFIQYYLLFYPLRWIRISVWLGISIAATSYTAVTITAFVMNSPWPGESFLDDIVSWHYLNFARFSVPMGVIGMLVDWYLLILPIPAVLSLQMSTVRKFGVLIVFMTGGLGAIASILSLYYRVRLERDPSDTTWNVGYVLLWAQIEMFAGVAASSMPTVKQFFARQSFSFRAWRSSSKSSSTHLLGSSRRMKLPDQKPSFTEWGGSNKRTSEDRERLRMHHLDSDGRERTPAEALRVENTQIRLTRDITVSREQVKGASFKLADPRLPSLSV